MLKKTRIVCAYVMTHDSGHAPNPFHDVCTLAICTPNHKRSRSQPGDWIIGLASADIRKKLGDSDTWRLIYAMQIEEKLDLNSYYTDSRFKAKIPKLGGSIVESCGDNFYCRSADGQLSHTRQTYEHLAEPPGTGIEKQDIDGDRVFVSQRYWYFGRNAPALPRGQQWAERLITKFSSLAIGLRNLYEEGTELSGRWSNADLSDFVSWLPEAKGILGNPIHWPDVETKETKISICKPHHRKIAKTTEKFQNHEESTISSCTIHQSDNY
jgi:hypothetical protein